MQLLSHKTPKPDKPAAAKRKLRFIGEWKNEGCKFIISWTLRVRAEINSQIWSVEAPAWQGAKEQEYQAYSELS